MFTRRDALFGVALHLEALGARSQTSSPPRRIGLLAWDSPRDGVEFDRFFVAALAKLGWTEARNISLVRAYAEEKVERLAALAKELVRSRIDVIVTSVRRASG
ncbi:MAG: hypothetical protein ABIO45_14840 [Burkholderiaceae bacterium]